MIDFYDNYSMTINGSAVDGVRKISVINPATEETIAEVPDASKAQLDEAVEAARLAFIDWRDRPLAERQGYVRQIGDLIEKHADHLMSLLTKEQGKPKAGAEWEIGGSIAWCRELATQALKAQLIEQEPGRTVETFRTPVGVVGAITPWNFPILLAVWKIAPALVAGNTVVLKPSPYTPLCTLKLGELIRDILPPGVLNIVSGGDQLGRWITEHPDIQKISFTGSTETGKKIMSSAAVNLKKITLELGGNDPAIVLGDVDPDKIAEELFWAAFQNSAQFCVSAKRIYIHESIYDAVSAALVTYAKTVKMGDGSNQGSQLGPIQNKMQYEKLKDLLQDLEDTGCGILLGGKAEDRKGYFIPVTIVDNPPEDSRVVVEEAFGPVLPLLKFSEIEDVIKRANNTPYGLAASVWSNDANKAKEIAKKLECGTVWINEIHSFSPHVAFGGHKQSGIGVENALEGLAEYTNVQTIVTRQMYGTQ